MNNKIDVVLKKWYICNQATLGIYWFTNLALISQNDKGFVCNGYAVKFIMFVDKINISTVVVLWNYSKPYTHFFCIRDKTLISGDHCQCI